MDDGRKVLCGKGLGNVLIFEIGGFGERFKNPIKMAAIPDYEPDYKIDEQTFPQ